MLTPKYKTTCFGGETTIFFFSAESSTCQALGLLTTAEAPKANAPAVGMPKPACHFKNQHTLEFNHQEKVVIPKPFKDSKIRVSP